MNHAIILIFHFLKSLGAKGIFLSMFIENIGIPLPTELGYLLGQEMINIHHHSYLFVLLVLTSGHLFGALVSYGIGRMGDNYITNRLKGNKKIMEVDTKVKKWYDRYGSPTVFLTRFVGYVRPWSSYVAGIAGVKLWPFILWTTLGSLLFNILNLYCSAILIVVWRRYEVFHFYIAIGMLVVFSPLSFMK